MLETEITYTLTEKLEGLHFKMNIELNGTPYTISSYIFGRGHMSAHLERHSTAIKRALSAGHIVEIISHDNRMLRKITTADEYAAWTESIVKVLPNLENK